MASAKAYQRKLARQELKTQRYKDRVTTRLRKRGMVEFDQGDLARLQGAISAMSTITGRSIRASVQHVTGTLCWGLIHATPNARAKRRVVRAPAGLLVDWQRQRQSRTAAEQAEYAVEVYGQGTPRKTYIGYGSRAGAMNSSARDIAMRGLARATWKRAYAKAKARGGDPTKIDSGKGTDAAAAKYSEGVLRAPRIDYAEAEIANQLPYVVILDRGGPQTPAHHIMATGAAKAVARQRWILRTMAARYGRAWETGRAGSANGEL
jgi:hypothetical protein